MEFLVCFLWKEKGRQFLFFLISHWLTSEYIYIFICILNNCVNRKKLGHYIFCMDWQDAIVIRWLVSQPNVQIVWQILVMIEMGGSNVCAFNRSQKRCFMMFYSVLSVYSYIRYVQLSTCPFYCGIRVTQKKKIHFMHLLWIIKFFCICIAL